MSRRRRRDTVTWGPTGMPDMRRRAVEVLELADQEARTPQERAALPALGRGRQVLSSADLFWVSHDMTELALDAATDLPTWIPFAEAPAPTGLILYERPLPDRSPLLTAEEAWVDGAPEKRRAEAMAMCGMMWACVAGGLTVWPVMREPRATTPAVMTGILATTVPSTEPIEAYPDRWAGPLALLGATWVLMAQDKVATAEPREVLTGRDAAIRSRRGQDPARVQVIDLRPMRYVPTDDGEADPATGRTYTHRWVVRGHWRQQPVGEGRTQRRPTWVSSYLKGPEGAPLLTGDRVYLWRR